MYREATNKEKFKRVVETWEEFGAIANSDLTTTKLREIEILLDDIGVLFDA